MQITIGKYLENPFATLGFVNKYSFDTFNSYNTLKHFFDERFNIPELANVYENKHKHELRILLSISCFAANHEYIFQALVQDVLKEKKHYNVLYVPLASHIKRLYESFTPNQKYEYYIKNENSSIESHIVRHYKAIYDYKSAFEAIYDNPNEILQFFLKENNNPQVYEMFRENIHFARVIVSFFNLIFGQNIENFDLDLMKGRWIFRCIIHDIPECYYNEFLNQDPMLLASVLTSMDLMLIEVPKIDSDRVYSQFKNLLNAYSHVYNEDVRILCNMIVDIRYSAELFNLESLNGLDDNHISLLARVALIANKMDIIYHVYVYPKRMYIQNIMNIENFEDLEKLLLYTEMLKCSGGQFDNEQMFGAESFLSVAIKYYAIKNIKYENDQLFVDLVATESCLKYNTLPFIRFISMHQLGFDERCFGLYGIESLWANIQVIDKEMFYSFLTDYEKLPIETKEIETSTEILEFIIKSPILIQKARDIGIKFKIRKDFEKLLSSMDKIEGLRDILDLSKIKSSVITNLRTKTELEKIEELTGTKISEFFIRNDSGDLTKADYFKWRLALNYLVEGDQRHRIREIRSQNIIAMLRLEFYDEMLELIGNEYNA